MEKFFLGIITGLGSLVLPLLLSSLFLPGPAGTFLDLGAERQHTAQRPISESEAEVQTTDAANENVPEAGSTDNTQTPETPTTGGTTWTRTELPKFGFSVETPDAWHNLSLADLKRMDSAGSFGEDAEDALILAVANAKTDDDLTGMMVFLDVGAVRLDPLQFMKLMESTVVQQLPVLRLKEEARRAKFADFDGASVMFETTPAARLIMPKMDQKFSVVELDGRAVIMTAATVPGSGTEAVITRMEQSLRPR